MWHSFSKSWTLKGWSYKKVAAAVAVTFVTSTGAYAYVGGNNGHVGQHQDLFAGADHAQQQGNAMCR